MKYNYNSFSLQINTFWEKSLSCQRELIDQILEGDATTILQDFPDQSIDCMVTSPPYFNQRDYGHPPSDGEREETYLCASMPLN